MLADWALGTVPPTGAYVELEPWWVRYKVHPNWQGSSLPKPPVELANKIWRGAVFRDGDWHLPAASDDK